MMIDKMGEHNIEPSITAYKTARLDRVALDHRYAYYSIQRLFDIVASSIALILLAIPFLRTAKEFVKCGLVQVVASDAHTLRNRGFAMTKAYEVLNEMNSKYPERFATNARDLLNGEQIDIGGIEMPRKQRKHWLF